MSRDYNKCIFSGRLGADPETRHMGIGEPVTNFRIAVGEQWKDKQTGEKQERTEWITIVAFGNLAKICTDYLRKGSHVLVDGKYRSRKWQDKTGADRWSTEIIAETLQMLGSPAGSRDGNNARPAAAPAAKARAAPASAPADDDLDSEIPF